MSYDTSPVAEKYERCKKAVEILKKNTKDPEHDMAGVLDALRNCEENGATVWNVSQLRLTIIELNAMRGYDDFCPLDEVTALFD